MKLILIKLFIVSMALQCYSAPYQSSSEYYGKKMIAANREAKKDMFVSRGWGAGGMPFSVLYMNPTFSSSKAPITVQDSPKPQYKKQVKYSPQLRTSLSTRQKNFNRTPHSVIPQLFVSYGWGPLGK